MSNIQNDELGGMDAEWGRVESIQLRFGLKKGFLYGLINRGEIESLKLQMKGSSRVTRLINVGSVRGFIERQRKTASLLRE